MNGRTERHSRWRGGLRSAPAVLLLVPLLAMLAVPGFAWGIEDFLAAALLIGGTGLAIELAVRTLRQPLLRLAAIGAAFLVMLVIWAELAVGLFD